MNNSYVCLPYSCAPELTQCFPQVATFVPLINKNIFNPRDHLTHKG